MALKIKRKKIFILFVMLCLIYSSFGSTISISFGAVDPIENPASSPASSPPALLADLEGHWAEKSLKEWMASGLIEGYPDGTFKPNRTVIRGEAIALINRSLGFQDAAPINFSDLSVSDWEYEDVAKAVKAGYVEGYANGTIGTKQPISRQEAAVIITRLLGLEVTEEGSAANAFTDAKQIPQWSKGAVAAIAAAQIMEGYEDGSFKPEASITRAEVIITLDRVLKSKTALAYNQAGTYGPADGVQSINGNVVVHTSGINLQNMKITGNLLLAEGIGEGDVFLRNVAVSGTTTVKGGGMNSLHFENSVLGTVIVDKAAGTVRIVLKDEAAITELIVKTPVILEQQNAADTVGIRLLKLDNLLPKGSKVTLIGGNIDDFQITAKGIAIDFLKGVIKKLTVAEEATDTSLTIGKDATILSMMLNAISKVFGQGKIDKANLSAKAKGTTFEKQPLLLEGPGVVYQGSWAGTGGGGETPVVEPNPITVVENGGARAFIIVATDAGQQIRKAADTLKEYVKKSTGAELQIKTVQELAGSGASNNDFANIYIGVSRTEDDANHQTLLQDMYSDGFIIDSKGKNITIIGPTPWGTEFGVYEFLERYVGVIWLMPGPDGEDVPKQRTIAVSPETVREKPATISRHFFGTESDWGLWNNAEWARRNRMHDNLQFHHNMDTLFDPKVFKDHPEYYPGGVVPTHAYEWQPCLNDQTAEAAIQRIMEYFDKNPDEISYSLGINDSRIYCEIDPGHPDYPGEVNSIGAVDMSDVYYPWVNKVVEGVLKQYPGKYFGLLAYANVYDPPKTVKLNPHVVPYITDDRMSWSDPAMEKVGKQHTENWQQAAVSLGFYDYMYGSLYNLPRMYMHQMAENYKYAQDHGVIGQVAELFPNFGEGPKPWVSAKLQWNPNEDVDQLSNEWYERAVGKEAAPLLAQYYSQWEQFWTTRIFETKWYKSWANSEPRANFLLFGDYSYFEAVTAEDMAASRLLLEEVVAKAETDEQKKRAGLLLRSFEYYEASALSYPRVEETAVPSNEQEALKMLDFIKESVVMAKKRIELRNQFKGDPILEISDYLGAGGAWDGIQVKWISVLQSYVITEPENGIVGKLLKEFIKEIGLTELSAMAVKTTASKAEILNSLDFSEGPWVDAASFSDFVVMDSKKEAPAQTNVYLLWDDVNLYVGYENFDSDMSKMIVSEDTPNGWWRSGGDDSNETFVTGNPKGAFTGFMTNPNGLSLHYNKKPNVGPVYDATTKWEVSARLGEDRWNVIQVIPFSGIGVDPQETKTLMGLFFRNYHGHEVFIGWGGGAPWRPEHFNPIHLVEKNLVQNPSFEAGDEEQPGQFAPWRKWTVDPSIQRIERTTAVARTGSYSIVHTGIDAGAGPFQDIVLTPGIYKEVLYYYVPEGVNGKLEIYNFMMDSSWEHNIESTLSPPVDVTFTKGKWEKFEHIFEIKPDYNGIPAQNLRMGITPWNLNPGDQVYFDDVALYKMTD
ncbi:DUF4838 domain-containing protein [Paenibacillus eucommiae]|uniref:SLH domain-containing protein n=1 Tax=Paenibacillus eucommiae TaxID=1355755 RepID=A0ABS4IZC4_9BACL|nr:DUF4838 domain-containing protein [Paenibacillus eucommiae]MBP1991889.1 hypothetical protein [Paenibacillus eucommiae]